MAGAIPGWKSQHREAGVEEAERGGKARHAAVVAADMQPAFGAARGEQCADRGRVLPLRRAEQADRARPLCQRAREFGQRAERGRIVRTVRLAGRPGRPRSR